MREIQEVLGVGRMLPIGEYMEDFIHEHELREDFMGFWRRHRAARKGKFPMNLAMREFLEKKGLWDDFLIYKDARAHAELLHSS